MLTVPFLESFPVGTKETLIVQLAPTAKGDDVTQLSVSEKSPFALRVVIRSAPFVELVRVRTCGGLVVPTAWIPKVSEAGDEISAGGSTVTGIATLKLEGAAP